MADRYKVYWQPGCSSCLRAKEFLAANDISYDSINVRAEPDAMADLARLGAQSIPVVVRGEAFVFAQDLGDLARFVGVTDNREALSSGELVHKLDLILAATQRYLTQFPASAFGTALPGRERDTLDLGYHIFVIPVAFLEAVRGAPLTFEFFERRTPEGMRSAAAVAAFGQGVRDDLATWWRETAEKTSLGTVETYYGVRSAESVLERTAWHAAQHARQLMELLEHQGIAPDGPLGATELEGLPLPDAIYDDEVALRAET